MIVLSANNIKKSYGIDVILKSVSISVQDNQRMGIVGPNGAGKTTLLKIITGEIEYDSGTVNLSGGNKAGYLKQETMITTGLTSWQTLKNVFDPVFAMERRMRDIESLMEHAHEDEKKWAKLSDEYNNLLESFEDDGGYSWKSLINGVMHGLGLGQELYDQEVSTLSGGQRSRLALAALLLQKPGLLLLDEPTNHLDTDAISWLEGYLAAWRGAVILVSHDRWFLDQVCTHIGNLHGGIIDTYEGNYTRFLAQKKERRRLQQKAYESNQKEIKRQQAIIDQFYVWGQQNSANFKKAKAREKLLEKIKRVEKPESDRATMRLNLTARKRGGNEVMIARNLSMAFGTNELFKDLDIQINKGYKVALLGPNGIGKTTLLRIIAGKLQQRAGDIMLGSGIDIGYYDQLQANLSENKTVMDELWDHFPKMLPQQIRDALGAFLFRGDEVFKIVSTLSGGERGRLSLLKLMLGKDNFLLLDEPTNHLDMESREILETALADFNGTVLFVSHDRYFINKVANRVMEMSEDNVNQYPGNWMDYLYHNSLKRDNDRDDTTILTKTALAKKKKIEREQLKKRQKLRGTLEEVENNILILEERNDEISLLLAKSSTLTEERLTKLSGEYATNHEGIEHLMERWESLSHEREELHKI